mmetsp:Transcript_29022/g.66105  ORF Transcript_29022/g.66105 Transcript_29022/m.66105 type:complete len:331 (-) Transcript_29022:238-1230(-)
MARIGVPSLSSSCPMQPLVPSRALLTPTSAQSLMSFLSKPLLAADRAKYPLFCTRVFSAPTRPARRLLKYTPGLILARETWPKASRGTSSPAASISATISSTPAPSLRKTLTQPVSSMTFLSRSPSAAMLKWSSGIQTAWTSRDLDVAVKHGADAKDVFLHSSRYFRAVAAVRYPESRPMTSWMMSMRGLAEDSLTTLLKNRAPCSAAVSAPKVCSIGTTSLSIVLGMPTTTTLPPCFSRMYLLSSAACVFVSSPPMVWRTLIPSLMSRCAATSRGDSPSFTKPRAMQSLMFVSLTLELPMGLPPMSCSRPHSPYASGGTTPESPVRTPL